MTDFKTEMKTQMEDMKDNAHQIKHLASKKGRELKNEAIRTGIDVTGYQPSASQYAHGAVNLVHDKIKDAEDDVGLAYHEARIKGRHANVELAEKKEDTSLSLSKTLTDAKEAIVDTVLPPTATHNKTSAGGVDISSVENRKNSILQEKEALHTKELQHEKEKEDAAKRQEMLDNVKHKVSTVSHTIKDAASSTGHTLHTLADSATITLGHAAVSLADTYDHLKAGPADEQMVPQERPVALTGGLEESHTKQPTLGDKIAHKLSAAVESTTSSIKNLVDPLQTVYVEKHSDSGVDISHVESGENEKLRMEREARLEKERVKHIQQEKKDIAQKLSPKIQAAKTSASHAAHSAGNALLSVSAAVSHAVSHAVESLHITPATKSPPTSSANVHVATPFPHSTTTAAPLVEKSSALTTVPSPIGEDEDDDDSDGLKQSVETIHNPELMNVMPVVLEGHHTTPSSTSVFSSPSSHSLKEEAAEIYHDMKEGMSKAAASVSKAAQEVKQKVVAATSGSDKKEGDVEEAKPLLSELPPSTSSTTTHTSSSTSTQRSMKAEASLLLHDISSSAKGVMHDMSEGMKSVGKKMSDVVKDMTAPPSSEPVPAADSSLSGITPSTSVGTSSFVGEASTVNNEQVSAASSIEQAVPKIAVCTFEQTGLEPIRKL